MDSGGIKWTVYICKGLCRDYDTLYIRNKQSMRRCRSWICGGQYAAVQYADLFLIYIYIMMDTLHIYY